MAQPLIGLEKKKFKRQAKNKFKIFGVDLNKNPNSVLVGLQSSKHSWTPPLLNLAPAAIKNSSLEVESTPKLKGSLPLAAFTLADSDTDDDLTITITYDNGSGSDPDVDILTFSNLTFDDVGLATKRRGKNGKARKK